MPKLTEATSLLQDRIDAPGFAKSPPPQGSLCLFLVATEISSASFIFLPSPVEDFLSWLLTPPSVSVEDFDRWNTK